MKKKNVKVAEIARLYLQLYQNLQDIYFYVKAKSLFACSKFKKMFERYKLRSDCNYNR